MKKAEERESLEEQEEKTSQDVEDGDQHTSDGERVQPGAFAFRGMSRRRRNSSSSSSNHSHHLHPEDDADADGNTPANNQHAYPHVLEAQLVVTSDRGDDSHTTATPPAPPPMATLVRNGPRHREICRLVVVATFVAVTASLVTAFIVIGPFGGSSTSRAGQVAATTTTAPNLNPNLAPTVQPFDVSIHPAARTTTIPSSNVPPSIDGITTLQPTFTATLSTTAPVRTSFDAFVTTDELKQAVVQYLADNSTNNPLAGARYGHPIGNWNVSSLTDFSLVFNNGDAIPHWGIPEGHCPACEFFNEDISGWDVSRAANMEGMFRGNLAFNSPLESWDVSKTTHMGIMFLDCHSFNQPLEKWDMRNVRWLGSMFQNAHAFNQPLDGWATENFFSLDRTFSYATAFNQPVGGWITSKVVSFSYTFLGAVSFNQPIGTWDTSSVTDMNGMFWEATRFNQQLETWNVRSIREAARVFQDAAAFNQPLDAWDVSSFRATSNMFNGATSFNQPLGNWSLSSVENLEYMFYRASSFNQNLCPWASRISGTVAVENGKLESIFDQTTCPFFNVPDFSVTPSGPFCHVCG